MKLQAFADLKGWTKQNLQIKIKRGIITERALVQTNGRNTGIISELADEDLKRHGKPFKAELHRAAGHKVGNMLATGAVGDNSGDIVENVEDDWLEAELAKEDGVLASTRPQEIPKSKKETRKIDGKDQEVTVVPPASADPFDRFRGAKTSKEEFAARKLELEVAEMEGRVLDTETVRKRIVKLVTETKDSLSNIPGKLAPLLVGITDVVEMETTLMKEMNNACASLQKLAKTKWNQDDEE